MSDLRPRSNRSKKPSPIARHGRLRTSHPLATIAKLATAVLGVFLVSGVSVAAIAAWDVGRTLKPGVHLAGQPTAAAAAGIGAIDGPVNVLLAGSDSGSGNPAYGVRGENLNDVTMLLHVSADHSSATVVSFPRDMFVRIPACPKQGGGSYDAMSSQKINTTLSYGGLACTVLTVQQLTGMTIPYAAEIQFDGVIGMSNAIGGVPVCVADRISDPYTGLNLVPGNHTLSGADALAFLRTRHGVGDGSDLGRISNQQVFLSSLVRTIKSAGTLGDPAKVYGLAKAAAAHMTLSDSLNSIPKITSIALALKNIDLNKVTFVQYPNAYGDSGGQSGVLPITTAADQLFAAISTDQPLSLSGSTGIGSELDPAASVAPAPSSAPGDGTSTSAPVTVLPDTVHGQTASQQTCSKVQPNNR